MPRQSTIAARRIRPPHRPWRAIRFRPCRQRAPQGRAVQHRAPVSAPSSARCGPARPCTPRSPLSTVPATGTFPIPIGRERRTFLPRWSYAGCSLVGTPQSGSAPGLSNTPGGISLRRRTVVLTWRQAGVLDGAHLTILLTRHVLVGPLTFMERAAPQRLALGTNQVVPVISEITAGCHAGLLLGMDADVSGDALSSPAMAKPAVAVVSVTSQRQRVERQTLRQPSVLYSKYVGKSGRR